jgi:hypothetical protein
MKASEAKEAKLISDSSLLGLVVGGLSLGIHFEK